MWNPIKTLIRRSRDLATSPTPFLASPGGRIITNDDHVSIDQALHNSDIFAVFNRVSSDMAACNFKTASEPVKQVLNHPLGNMISKYSFWQSVVWQMMERGNAFAVITERDDQGNPTRIELVPFEKVRVVLNDNGDDIEYHVHWDDTNRSGDFAYSSKDMLHFRLIVDGEFDTQYMGVSPLMSLAKEVSIQDQSNKLSLATLAHAISPSTFLKVPLAHLNKKAKDNLRESFEQQTTGENAGRAIVVDQSADVVQTQISPDIAKFLENTTFSQDQIAKAFCIPADYLSGKQDAQSNIDQIRSFYQSSLSGYIGPIESELTNKLGTEVKLDVDAAVDIDHSQLLSHLNDMVKNGLINSDQAQKILISRGVFPELTQIEPVEKSSTSQQEGGEMSE